MSGYDSVNRSIESRAESCQRRCRRNLWWQAGNQQPKMLGCQQWSGELEAGWGSRCRKSKALGDLEGRQRSYDGAQPCRTLYARTSTLDLMRSGTCSQWRLMSLSETWY